MEIWLTIEVNVQPVNTSSACVNYPMFKYQEFIENVRGEWLNNSEKEFKKVLLELNSPPPAKQMWSHPEFSKRRAWSRAFEAIAYFFLSSNSIRKNYVVYVVVKGKCVIRFEGEKLRYLSMSLRSAASLVYKAYQSCRGYEWSVSSPGVWVKKIDVRKPDSEIYFMNIDFQASTVLFKESSAHHLIMNFHHPSQIIAYLNYQSNSHPVQ